MNTKKILILLSLLAISAFLYLDLKNKESSNPSNKNQSLSKKLLKKNIHKKNKLKKSAESSNTSIKEYLKENQTNSSINNDLTKEELKEIKEKTRKAHDDFNIANKSFPALQSSGPKAFSMARAASIKHNFNILTESGAISRGKEEALKKIFESTFMAKAKGDKDFESKEEAALRKVLGDEETERFQNLKASLKASEVMSSVQRRIGSLESELDMNSLQLNLAEQAMIKLEEDRALSQKTKNPKEAHAERVKNFESELESILSPQQFEKYKQTKPQKKPAKGINPFTSN